MIKKDAYSRGWRKANEEQKKSLMKGLKKIYKVTTPQAVYAHIRGDVPNSHEEHERVEKLFARYGITGIWGEKKKVAINA